MQISPAFRMLAVPFSPVNGNNGFEQAVTPVGPVVAADMAQDTDTPFQRGAAALSSQLPPDDGQTGSVAVNEAPYRPSSNWSVAPHDGRTADPPLPHPDVIAAYHRDDAPRPAVEAEGAAAIVAHVDIVV